LNRASLLLQSLILVLVVVCLLEVERVRKSAEAVLLVAGSPSPRAPAPPARDPDSLLEELRGACDRFLSNPQDPVEQRLAERQMDASVAALKALGGAGFGPLAAALDSPAPAAFRQRVLETMAGIDPGRTIEPALRIFRSPGDPILRMAAAAVAMRLDPDRTLPELVSLLRKESERSFPPLGEAVSLAAEKGGPDVERALLDLAEHPDRGRSSSYRAIEALGVLKAPAAVASLRRIVLSEPQDGVLRRKGIQALVQIQGKEGCPFLEECARGERDEIFRLFLENVIKETCRK
jgi:hypothetical protein